MLKQEWLISSRAKIGKYITNESETIKISIVVQTCCNTIAHDIEKYVATLLMKLNYTNYNRHESAQPT